MGSKRLRVIPTRDVLKELLEMNTSLKLLAPFPYVKHFCRFPLEGLLNLIKTSPWIRRSYYLLITLVILLRWIVPRFIVIG